MQNIKNSKLLKTICYCFVPILTLMILASAGSLIYYSEYEEDFVEYQSYIDTQGFANQYLSNILRAVRIVKNETETIITENTDRVENETETIEESDLMLADESGKEEKQIQSNFYSIPNYYVLVISPEGDVLTNVEKTINTDTVEEIKDYILNQKHFWQYDGTKVETNIDKLQYDEIAYNGFEQIQEYQIYTSVKDENAGQWYRYNLLYNFVGNTYEIAPSIIVISSLLLLVCGTYILISIGHKEGKEEIYTDSLDKILYEVVIVLAGILFAIEICILVAAISLIKGAFSKTMIDTGIILSIAIGFIMYITIAVVGVTTIRRIKAHVFWKNTVIYRFFKFLLGGLFTNLSQTVKLAVEYGGFILASVVLFFITMQNPIVVLFLFAFWYYIFKKILDYTNKMEKIRRKIGSMYHGENDTKLEEEEFYGELRVVARELNDISSGLSNAIEEAMKSERLKTELITNVSHDIKTPLTSIINYVDLMKKEEIQNPKIQEYLEVLDSKSQRLKKLTEDLIEASKASSGNIKLTMEPLNVKELIKQVRGEFEDRFNQKGLQIIETFPEEEVIIEADSRYLYRVMENMYVNISKYALENSRVYIDVTKTKGKVQIALKNISQDKLNITVDELMQRFVRGDTSRTTEGSGLGISIAKSLTQLQKGSFNIYLDGDLFKVVIEFDVK